MPWNGQNKREPFFLFNVNMCICRKKERVIGTFLALFGLLKVNDVISRTEESEILKIKAQQKF